MNKRFFPQRNAVFFFGGEGGIGGGYLKMFLASCAFAFIVACQSSPVFASSSLFFTPEETQAIESFAQAEKQKPQDAPQTDISLDAILYYGPHDWKIWLQGEPWTPDTKRSGLRVLTVSPDRVVFKLGDSSGTSSARITLKPHQTWKFGTNHVIEDESLEVSPTGD